MSEEEKAIISQIKNMAKENASIDCIQFKKVDKQKIGHAARKINGLIKFIKTDNITDTNNLIRAGAAWIAQHLGLKRVRVGKKTEPWWKRRIERDIKRLRKDINILERSKRGELKSQAKFRDLDKNYCIRKKGLSTVIEELKQRLLAKSAKIKRYEQRITQYRQNRLFQVDQKKLFQEWNEDKREEIEIPDAEESRNYWNNIWGVQKEHEKDAEWLHDLKNGLETGNKSQENFCITREMVKTQVKKVPNWKAPGRDGVQGFWLKKFDSLHSRITDQLNDIVNGVDSLPQWMTYGKTVLCQKDRRKGNAVDNYRPISCLPLMWKLLTGMIAENIYLFLEKNKVLPDEQKGCRKGSKGTKDQLLIDKAILKDCKRRHTNLSMAWIDYRKAYDMIPHSWILECLDIFGVARNVKQFITDSMSKWKVELTSMGESLGDVSIKRGIFQGDSLSPLLFVLCMVPLTLILRKTKACYKWGNKEFKINHLLFMDDLKLFGKDLDQIDSLVQTVHIFSTDIGMEFGLKKCGVLIMKRGKLVKLEGVTLPDGHVMREVEQDGYKYLGIVELDKIKEAEMKDQFRKEYIRRLRLVLKSKLNGRNKITAINTWAVAVLRYGGGLISWTEEEMKNLDRKTRKLMTMNGALHPRSDVNRLYVPRTRGGRGLISCEGCIKSEVNNLGWYIKNTTEMLLIGARATGVLKTNGCTTKMDFKRNWNEQNLREWKEKRMYGQFVREMPDTVEKEESWRWLRTGDLKVETEALICAAQEQALRTNSVKYHVDKSIESPLCRLCGEHTESVSHIVAECKKLAQREYKRRHDNVAKIVHWKLCKKYDLESKDKWYEHVPLGCMENDTIKLLWDINVQCDHVIEARRPDIILVDKENKVCTIIDVAVPGDIRVGEKETEKVEKYQDLKREIAKIWKMKEVKVVPIVVGALGSVSRSLGKWIDKLGIKIKTEFLQKTALLGTARILRKVLER